MDCNSREKRGYSSISLGPPVVYKDPGNHTVEVGHNFQFYCKIKANPLAHVAMKFNPVNRPITVSPSSAFIMFLNIYPPEMAISGILLQRDPPCDF